MKKPFSIFCLILLLAVSFTGCFNTPSAEESSMITVLRFFGYFTDETETETNPAFQAGLDGWKASENGFRYVYEGPNVDTRYAPAILAAFERMEEKWTSDEYNMHDEELFILYGCTQKGIGPDMPIEDLDWFRIANLLSWVIDDAGYPSNIEPFNNLKQRNPIYVGD